MNKRIQIITGATVLALATPFLGFDLRVQAAATIVDDQCINQQSGRQLNTDFCNCLNLQGRWIVPDQVKDLKTDEVLGGTSKAFCEVGFIGEDGSSGPSETGSVIPGGGGPPPVVVDGGGVAKGNNGKGQQVADGPPPGIGNSTNDETAPGEVGSEPVLPPGQREKQ